MVEPLTHYLSHAAGEVGLEAVRVMRRKARDLKGAA